MSSPAPLVTTAWWRVLLERVLRQEAQTAIPILTTLVTAAGHFDLAASVLALAGAAAVTLVTTTVRYLADIQVDPASPWWKQFLDRSVWAAAGVVAAVPLGSWADTVAVDWVAVGKAALVALALAHLSVYGAPAQFTHRPRHAGGARSSATAGLRNADRMDGGWARAWVVVVLAVSALALAAVPASAHRWGPDPRHGRSVLQLPEIQHGVSICGGASTQLAVRVLAPHDTTWVVDPDGPGLLKVEGWSVDRWVTPPQEHAIGSSLTVKAGFWRWRPYLSDHGRRLATGPEYRMSSDLCAEQ